MNKIYIKDKLKACQKRTGKRMAEIAVEIIPEKTPNRARTLLSRWANGYDYSALMPHHIMRMSLVLKTTPNQIFQWKR